MTPLRDRLARLKNRITRLLSRTLGVRDGVQIRGEVDVALYDVDELRDAVDGWDELGKAAKRAALLEADVEPVKQHSTTNTTVDDLHRYLVDNLDRDQDVNENATHLAVGTDDAAPTTADGALGNEVYRAALTDVIDNGTDLTTSTFLDSSEANGNTLREVGLYTADAATGGILLNHALITEIPKDDTKTATIDVELQFQAV